MKVFVRSDASIDIGSGHIMRCLTLADKLRKEKSSVEFISSELEGNYIGYLEERGFKVHSLPSNITKEQDQLMTKDILENSDSADWLVIDHYDLDADYEQDLRNAVKRIMVIDDLADRRHDCDILLDQNYSLDEGRYRDLVSDQCQTLLGTEFALLRSEFLEGRKSSDKRDGRLKRILISMGGVDQGDETVKILKAIKQTNRDDLKIDVIIGSCNPNKENIETLASQIKNVECFSFVNNIAEFMKNADLSIGAGGTTTWERCSLGLPSLVTILAENQRDISESLGKQGAIINLGWFNKLSEDDYMKAIQELTEDKLRNLEQKALELVDGQGSQRVVNEMLMLSKG